MKPTLKLIKAYRLFLNLCDSSELVALLCNCFVNYSNPNNGGSDVPAPWPPFTKNHHPYMTINHNIDKSSIGYDDVT